MKEPEAYLGAEIRKWTIDGSDDPTKVRWAMSSNLYVKRVVPEVERELSEIDMQLVTTVSTPMSQGYRAELGGDPRVGCQARKLLSGVNWSLALDMRTRKD